MASQNTSSRLLVLSFMQHKSLTLTGEQCKKRGSTDTIFNVCMTKNLTLFLKQPVLLPDNAEEYFLLMFAHVDQKREQTISIIDNNITSHPPFL